MPRKASRWGPAGCSTKVRWIGEWWGQDASGWRSSR